ncbi:unannotated protein [freshwater metagenome]|uniref:Unannotated protein n=1 Tax=freshwater metagenome TaxID=449393 RepID=A0A6J7KPH2_9ZZZZ
MGRRRRSVWSRARPETAQLDRPAARRYPRLCHHLRAGSVAPAASSSAHRSPPRIRAARRGAPRGRLPGVGRGSEGGVRTSASTPVPHRHALPHACRRTHSLRAVRAVVAGRAHQRGRLRVLLPQCARRRRCAARGVCRLLGHEPLDELRRRAAGRQPWRRLGQGGGRRRLAHRARPQRRVGSARDRGGGRPGRAPARVGHAQRSRADPGLRPRLCARLRKDRQEHHR